MREVDIARLEDMSPNGHLRVFIANDGDVSVEVFDGEQFASVEFCSCGAGGGRSPNTRAAIVNLAKALDADNKADPSRAHWRSIGAIHHFDGLDTEGSAP